MARIIMNHVEKAYPGGVKAVDDLSLDVKDGEFVVFVGPSGCGKSTALRSIAGLEEITGGTIQIGDRVVNDLPPKDRDIAVCPSAIRRPPLHWRSNRPRRRAFSLGRQRPWRQRHVRRQLAARAKL
jgi:ABC-type multidrug transport system ATPase subunit